MKDKILSFIMLSLFSNSALAFYCGSTLIEIGISQANIKSACGSPTKINTTKEETPGEPCKKYSGQCITVTTQNNNGTPHTAYYEKKYITHENWVYDFGSTSLKQILSFEDGEVSNIQEGGYGE